jgi:hypothetical protein
MVTLFFTYLFLWPLYCLSVLDLRFLITSLVASNFSHQPQFSRKHVALWFLLCFAFAFFFFFFFFWFKKKINNFFFSQQKGKLQNCFLLYGHLRRFLFWILLKVFSFLCSVISIICLFVLFLLAIVLSIFLRFADSDYPFSIFRNFL